MKKEDILNYLQQEQNNYYNRFGITFIGLFGSYARDEANKRSDIDILYEIEPNQKLSLFKYLELINELEKSFHKKIDLVRKSTLKPQIKKYILQDLVYV